MKRLLTRDRIVFVRCVALSRRRGAQNFGVRFGGMIWKVIGRIYDDRKCKASFLRRMVSPDIDDTKTPKSYLQSMH